MDHPLAMTVEAEMAGLDDPGMHRPTATSWISAPATEKNSYRRSSGRPAESAPASARHDLPARCRIARGSRARSNGLPGNPVSALDRRRRPTPNTAGFRHAHRRRLPPAAARVSVTRRAVSSNSRPPSAMRARTSRRNAAISRSGTAAISSGIVLRAVAKAIALSPPRPRRRCRSRPTATAASTGRARRAERSPRRRSAPPIGHLAERARARRVCRMPCR